MFEEPGIDLDQDLEWTSETDTSTTLRWPMRLGNPTDWASFRRDLAEALAAAFSLERTPPWADDRGEHDRRTRRQVLAVLDSIRFRHHPTTGWVGFFDALWARRAELRDDL